MNKKGAEMTIGTIIVIILALVVLVVIIYGFTTGWGNLWQRITGFGGGKINVQSVVDGCKVACTSESVFEYCQRERQVIFEEKGTAVTKTCADLQGSYGLEPCSVIDCGSSGVSGKACEGVSGWNGMWSDDPCDKSGSGYVEVSKTLIISVDKDSHLNQLCCAMKISSCKGTWVASGSPCDTGTYDVTFMITDAGKKNHLTDKCCVD